MATKKTLTDEHAKVLEELIEYNLFSNCDKDFLQQLIISSQIESFPPHFPFWERNNKLELSVIIKGAVAVNYDEKDLENIDCFSFKGQLLGEFELLDLPSKAQRLITLNDTTILTPSIQDLDHLKLQHPEKFYKNLAKSFASKMYHKNDIISLLSHNDVIDRITFLLRMFNSESLGLKIPRTNNAYEIDIFWSDKNLESILSTSFRTLKNKLAELIEENLIEISLIGKTDGDESNKKFEVVNILSADYLRNEAKKRIDNFIKIAVLNYSDLLIFQSKNSKKTKS